MLKPKNKCLDCGKELSKKRCKRCDNCSRIARRTRSQEDRSEYSRNWQLKKKYGMEFGEFDAWWIVFQGKCGICQRNLKMPEKRQGQSLDVVAVDHDHKTGKIRGLLCNACNKGLGLFYDSVELLERARRYLYASNGNDSADQPDSAPQQC